MDEDKDEIIFDEPGLDESEEKPKSSCNCCCIFFIIFLIIAALAIAVFFYLRSKSSKNNWDNAYEEAKLFVSQLNLTEKIGLLYGTENLRFRFSQKIDYKEKASLCVGQINAFDNKNVEFPGMCLQDGTSGIRFAKGTGISWQSSINTAATFNKKLMYDVGKSQGEESKIRGVNTFLSPCVNIMRTPQGGRIWEGYGEDPYLTGIAGAQVIKGIQDSGVIATVKHFLGNEQETYRKASSSNIELQALMDIYVEPFYRAVKADVGAVMCSYNAINNTYACENEWLLTEVLRGILGFRGFVMSDWWAIYNNDSQSFNSGTDMNMPGGITWGSQYVGRNGSFWSSFEQYVNEKKITEKRITEAATRIIATMYKMEQIYGEKDFPRINLYRETKDDSRRRLQRRVATESIILLKNNGILPLKDIENRSKNFHSCQHIVIP